MSKNTNFMGQMLGLIIITLLLSATQGASSIDNNNSPRYLFSDCLETGFSYSLGSTFEENLNHILTEVSTEALRLLYSNYTTNGTGIDQVFALYYCRGDVDGSTCYRCVKAAVNTIKQKCRLNKQGIVWYEECTLRYANHTISSLDEEHPVHFYINSTRWVTERLNPYRQDFTETMNSLINDTAYNGNPPRFATKEVNLSELFETLRGLAQCSPFISSILCQKCLETAFRMMYRWSNTMVHLPSCFIRFDIFQLSSSPSPPPNPDGQWYKILLAVLSPVIVILLLLCGFCFWRRRQISVTGQTNNAAETTQVETSSATEATEGETNIEETRLQLARFTYSQVKNMTNEFNRKLGEGGYGIVYYGRLSDDHKEVAVKVLSNDAPKQFSNEVKVLGRIYHKNLVSLIGYCEEGSNLALIYEYISGGDLKALLAEHSGVVVSWKRRLAIAFDTAQGLDYLHSGCSPPIVHRDVKPANILLNQHFLQAKVADFGFSKIFPAVYVSKLQTRVIGTTGYVDPQYHLTGQVNEKSDVYSFGVVLLELITGKSAIIKYTNTHLVQWITPLFERGDIGSILDPRLRLEVGENYNTIWRATELAKQCVELDPAYRPTMSNIVIELRECLARENANVESSSSVTTSMEMMTAPVSTTSMGPQPR